MDPLPNNVIIQAFLNVHRQSGLPVNKQKQIEDFICRNRVDILHWNTQTINIDEESSNHYIKLYNNLK